MTDRELFVKMGLDLWQAQVRTTNQVINKLTDDQLEHEIAPGRNRGIYLLGHLTAVHDLMLPLLRFEEALHPDLKPVFVDAPDKAVTPIPPAAQLRAQWTEVNEKLQSHFTALAADEWLTRHASVSEEDFVKEPHRNRLNVLLGRIAHLSNHRGQLVLLVPKG